LTARAVELIGIADVEVASAAGQNGASFVAAGVAAAAAVVAAAVAAAAVAVAVAAAVDDVAYYVAWLAVAVS